VKKRILLVEDSADFRDAFTATLEAHGFAVTHAGDGVEASPLAKADTPDLGRARHCAPEARRLLRRGSLEARPVDGEGARDRRVGGTRTATTSSVRSVRNETQPPPRLRARRRRARTWAVSSSTSTRSSRRGPGWRSRSSSPTGDHRWTDNAASVTLDGASFIYINAAVDVGLHLSAGRAAAFSLAGYGRFVTRNTQV
jgi:hypothetical protein